LNSPEFSIPFWYRSGTSDACEFIPSSAGSGAGAEKKIETNLLHFHFQSKLTLSLSFHKIHLVLDELSDGFNAFVDHLPMFISIVLLLQYAACFFVFVYAVPLHQHFAFPTDEQLDELIPHFTVVAGQIEDFHFFALELSFLLFFLYFCTTALHFAHLLCLIDKSTLLLVLLNERT
jgi:hypothetical protein